MGSSINDVSLEGEGGPKKPMKGDENMYLVLENFQIEGSRNDASFLKVYQAKCDENRKMGQRRLWMPPM